MTPTRADLDAITLDAFETLVFMADPVAGLVRALREQHELTVEPARCARAMAAEMRHYAAVSGQARDDDALAAVRLGCGAVLADELGVPGIGPREGARLVAAAVVFDAYPDARETIDRIVAAGLRVGVVSNWDVSLHDELARTGLAAGLDHVVTSAECGHRKPDPAIYHEVLRRLGVAPARALHVGDSAVGDVDGARAAGMHAIHVQRRAAGARRTPRIGTLLELVAILDLDDGA
jgi:putative hydrolase of the HAD superfamily